MSIADSLITISDKLVTVAENQQKVFDAGRDAEWSQFWDTLQGNGERRNYNYCFYSSNWDDTNFKPKYDFIVTSANSMFRAIGVSDLRQTLLDAGVTLDLSKCSTLAETFTNTTTTALPVISAVSATSLSHMFAGASKLVTIEKLILKDDGSQAFSSTFASMNSLENIVIEGVIGNNVSFSSSAKLTHDSLMSIINALKDHSDSTETHTCTLGATNLAKLTDAERAIATQKGWTLA